jgi:hypothetical protein
LTHSVKGFNSQSLVPVAFGALVRQKHHGREHVMEETTYFIVDGKQREKERKGLRSQYPLQGQSPNNLTSFH